MGRGLGLGQWASWAMHGIGAWVVHGCMASCMAHRADGDEKDVWVYYWIGKCMGKHPNPSPPNPGPVGLHDTTAIWCLSQTAVFEDCKATALTTQPSQQPKTKWSE